MDAPGTSYFTPKQLVFIILFCLLMITIMYKYDEHLHNRQLTNMERLSNVINGVNHRLAAAITTTTDQKSPFGQHVSDFIEAAAVVNVKVVLIDPLMLYKMLDQKERRILNDNDLLSKTMLKDLVMDTEYCTAFAIFSDDISALKTKLSPRLKALGFSDTWIDGSDGSKRHFTKSTADLQQTLLHVFYTKDGTECIQICVFHARQQWLWMGAVPDKYFTPDQNNTYILPKRLHYGRNESAFDQFEPTVRNVSLNNHETQRVVIPEPSLHFVGQIKTSTFIECNHAMARNFHKTQISNYTRDDKMDAKVRDALLGLKHMARKLSIPIYISSGTLLGWHRQCGVIPYTSDLDTATWSTYASLEATDQWLHNDVGFRLTYVYGLPENGYQYAFYTKSSFRVDLFYTYYEYPNLTYTGHQPSQHMYFRYWYPYFTLCSVELVGVKIHAPCSPEYVVSSEYGPEWYKPKTSWSYISSAFNTGPHRHWADNDEAKRAYKEYD